MRVLIKVERPIILLIRRISKMIKNNSMISRVRVMIKNERPIYCVVFYY